MKKIIALLCGAILIGTLAACAESGGDGGTMPPPTGDETLKLSEYTDADFDASGDVAIETEYEVYGIDAPWVSYTVTNHTSEELVYGVAYGIEVLQDKKWYQVPFPDNMAWIMIGIILKPNDTNAHSFGFSELDYRMTDGTYRLIKEIGGKRYFGVFHINKSSPITAETPFRYQALEKLPVEYTIETAVKNGDVVITHTETLNIAMLEDFVNKASFGMAAMVRIVQYTDEGDPIITDFIYNDNGSSYYVYRHDNTRDKFGGDHTGITETIYSYLITDGERLYLSNCVSWELLGVYTDAALIEIAPTAEPRDVAALTGLVGEMARQNIAGSVRQYQVMSPGGDKSVSLLGDLSSDTINENLSYGYSIPGRGDTRTVSDPEGIATRIIDVVWLDNEAFVLICETTSSLKYYEAVGGANAKSGYGSDYRITDGRFEIVG